MSDIHGEIEESLAQEIRHMDMAQDLVLKKLAENVQNNHTTFVEGMNQVQEVDLDIARAVINVRNGRRLLKSTHRSMVMKHLNVVQLNRKVTRLHQIHYGCEKIQQLFEKEKQIDQAMERQKYGAVVSLYLHLKKELFSPEMKKLTILDALRERISSAVDHLSRKLDKVRIYGTINRSLCFTAPLIDVKKQMQMQVLSKLVFKFDGELYGEILTGYSVIAKELSKLPCQIKGYDERICETMYFAIEQATQGQIHSIIHDLKRENKAQTAQSGLLPPTAINRTSQQMVLAILQCYEHLVSLLYQYYSVIEWHELQVGEQVASTPADADEAYPTDEFNIIRTALAAGKDKIWSMMQKQVADFLMKLDIGDGMKLKEIVFIYQSTEKFLAVGTEFCGNALTMDSIQHQLKLHCHAFLERMHKDSLDAIRMIMDTEEWIRVPYSLEEKGGIIPLVEQQSGYIIDPTRNKRRASRPRNVKDLDPRDTFLDKFILTNDEHGRSKSTIFSSFASSGNPFRLYYADRQFKAAYESFINGIDVGEMCGSNPSFQIYTAKSRSCSSSSSQEEPFHEDFELLDSHPHQPESHRAIKHSHFGSEHVICPIAMLGFIR